MICFRDMTFCPFFTECAEGGLCDRRLDSSVLRNAKKIGLPICQYVEKPKCFKQPKNITYKLENDEEVYL